MKSLFIVILVFVSCSSTSALKSSFKTKKEMTSRSVKKEEKAFIPIEKETVKPIVSLKSKPKHILALENESSTEVRFLIPAKVVLPKHKLDIWEVQVIAVSDQNRAENELKEIKTSLNLQGRIVETNGVYKVRVGQSKNRVEMDQLVAELNTRGYGNAWVVKDIIDEVLPDEKQSYYTLQIGVFSTNLSALNLKKSLKDDFSEPIIIKFINGLYKVFIGKEKKRENLIVIQDRLTNKQIKAWVTEQKM